MPTLVFRLCDDGGVTWHLAGEGCTVGMGCTMYEGDHDAMKAFFDPLLTWSGGILIFSFLLFPNRHS